MKNKGKKFEQIIFEAFSKTEGVSIDRFIDPPPGYFGVANVSDFVAYKFPYQYYIECKTTHGATLNFKSAISETQWKKLLEKYEITGVFSGILVWFVKYDFTCFLSIHFLNNLKKAGYKSFNVKNYLAADIVDAFGITVLHGKKKRIYFEYDVERFFEDIKNLNVGGFYGY